MSKIFTTKLSKELKDEIKKSISQLECGITSECLDNFKDDINIKYIASQNNILAFCIYSDINKNRVLEDLGDACDHYDDETYEYYEQVVQDLREDTIYIHYLEAIERGHGYGAELVNSILSLGRDVILYSTIEAEEFWSINDFDNIFGYEYIHYNK